MHARRHPQDRTHRPVAAPAVGAVVRPGLRIHWLDAATIAAAIGAAVVAILIARSGPSIDPGVRYLKSGLTQAAPAEQLGG